MTTLTEIPRGHVARVREVEGPRAFRRRLMEMGLVSGVDVKIVTVAPLGDPIQIEVRGGQWSIRRSEAAKIRVAEPGSNASESNDEPPNVASSGISTESRSSANVSSAGASATATVTAGSKTPPSTTDPARRLHVVLAGNPNVGKTTLFNALTGSTAKVSNYPGITVERRRGQLTLTKGRVADVDDIPGTYSINARSAEEQIAIDGLLGVQGAAVPDVVVACVDATNVARSSYLVLQLQELGVRCVVAMTMIDEAKTATPEPRALAELLGCEVVGVTARTKHGLPDLIAAIDRASHREHRAMWRWTPSRSLDAHIDAVRAGLPTTWSFAARHGLASDGLAATKKASATTPSPSAMLSAATPSPSANVLSATTTSVASTSATTPSPSAMLSATTTSDASTSAASTSATTPSDASPSDATQSATTPSDASPSDATQSAASTSATTPGDASTSDASTSDASKSAASTSATTPSDASPSDATQSAASTSATTPGDASTGATTTTDAASTTTTASVFDLADRALALWALTCIEPRTGDDEDELDVPDELRAAVNARGLSTDARVSAEPRASSAVPRAPVDTRATDGGVLDDEAVLGRWRFLDREIPPLVKRAVDRRRTQRIDRVLLHRVAGFGVFAVVMSLVFMSLFWGADPLIGGIESVFSALGELVRDKIGTGIVADFIVDGVIAGVGGVIVFLPQIMLLFLFLGFLEDCGYLARIAYLMDRVMRSMNLHGRAFVPMLSGFACAIPAILATRTMERRRDRILTMMVVPLMTCSARLPVYTLVIAALLPGSAIVQGLVMVGMYLFSVVTALAAAWVMSKTVKPLKAKRLPFLIELPPYRVPRGLDVLRSMRTKSWMFLREAGTVILACSIALWALLYFPRELPSGSPDFAALAEKATTDEAKKVLAEQEASLRLENSYGGRIGHAIEPAIAPLGFDWKIGVGIVGAFAAREVFVSTLGIVFGLEGADEDPAPLRDAIRDAKKSDGSRAYTPLMGLSLMIFFALACQCMSTLAVVRRETRSWGWPAFLFGYMTVLAWVMSFLVYQGGRLLGFS